MPHTRAGRFEHASALGHVPTVRHPMIAAALGRYQLPASRVRDLAAIDACLIDPAKLGQDTWVPRWAMATDSSPFEHVVDPAFPSTRLIFAQMSAVMVDLQRLRSRVGHFVDPAAVRDAQHATVMAGVLPSSNLVRSDGTPPRRAFREAVDELLRTRHVEGRSLLEVLQEVQANRPDTNGQSLASVSTCPNPDCQQPLTGPDGRLLQFDERGTVCPRCDETILFSDLLRAHETFREHGENGEACGRIMSVAERLITLGFLDHVHARLRGAVGDIALVTDGPLALFGEVAKLKSGILRRMQSVAQELRADGLRLPAIVGIEKSGIFAEHARAIRTHIPPGFLMAPDHDYIERYITFRGSTHGAETYYGRHFFYRSRDRRMHVITIPPLGRPDALPHDTLTITDYPTLACTCALIDSIGTRLYDDATIPLVLAHRFAAYPAETAGEVLRLHVDENLGQPNRRAA
jgi:hypothetical protein